MTAPVINVAVAAPLPFVLLDALLPLFFLGATGAPFPSAFGVDAAEILGGKTIFAGDAGVALVAAKLSLGAFTETGSTRFSSLLKFKNPPHAGALFDFALTAATGVEGFSTAATEATAGALFFNELTGSGDLGTRALLGAATVDDAAVEAELFTGALDLTSPPIGGALLVRAGGAGGATGVILGGGLTGFATALTEAFGEVFGSALVLRLGAIGVTAGGDTFGFEKLKKPKGDEDVVGSGVAFETEGGTLTTLTGEDTTGGLFGTDFTTGSGLTGFTTVLTGSLAEGLGSMLAVTAGVDGVGFAKFKNPNGEEGDVFGSGVALETADTSLGGVTGAGLTAATIFAGEDVAATFEEGVG